jgi:hypothetical protein
MTRKQTIDLDSLPEFLALDTKRQTVARGIQQGVSYSKAITSVGLNATRERRNPMLQRVLWLISMGVSPEGKAPTAAEPSIYELAAEIEKERDTWSAERKAAYDAELKRQWAVDDAAKRAARLAQHPNCDGCGNPLNPADALIRGIHIVCAACTDIWNHTGVLPNSTPTRIVTPSPVRTRRCRVCHQPAGPRDVVCTDASCCGALEYAD